jgi:hypothetical protein
MMPGLSEDGEVRDVHEDGEVELESWLIPHTELNKPRKKDGVTRGQQHLGSIRCRISTPLFVLNQKLHLLTRPPFDKGCCSRKSSNL